MSADDSIAQNDDFTEWCAQPQPVYTTDRLQLRPFTMYDADEVEPLVSLWEIAATTLSIPHPYPKGEVANWLAHHGDSYREGKSIHYAAVLRDSGELIGSIGLAVKSGPLAGVGDLGYWIAPSHWNKGFGTEAATAMLRCGFEFAKLHRIEAHHFTTNPASGRLMQKIGMTREGQMRERVRKWGEWLDIVLYGILRREWEAMWKDGGTLRAAERACDR